MGTDIHRPNGLGQRGTADLLPDFGIHLLQAVLDRHDESARLSSLYLCDFWLVNKLAAPEGAGRCCCS